MKKLAFALLLLLSTPAFGWEHAAMNKQIDQTNFLMNDNCSATLIDKSLLLTANHCISTQFEVIEKQEIADDGTVTKKKVRIAKPGTVSQLGYLGPNMVQRTSYIFKIKAADRERDLALVEVKAKLPNQEVAKIACHDPQRGDHVYAVGNSYSILYSTLTDGIISSVTRDYPSIRVDDQGDHGLTQFSAPIVGGNSGGALYNDNGHLIGVNVRSGATGFAMAVTLSDIKEFLKHEGLEALWKGCEP